MEQPEKLYTDRQLNRWKQIALGLREGLDARNSGGKQRDCPYPSGTPIRKGWRKGWRRRDKEIKEQELRNKYGYVLPGSEVFYIPPQTQNSKQRGSRGTSTSNISTPQSDFRRGMSKIYKR